MTAEARDGRSEPSHWAARRPALVDLLLLSSIICWFYWPFLQQGLPPGDFASDVMVAEMGDRLIAHPLAFPTWNPYTMCGRPMTDFFSPFQVFKLPFLHLDPIARLKAVVLLFHVLGGLAMYALLHGIRAGKDAALFAGVAYPIMTSHLSRSAIQGHIHVPMFYAILPLIFLALFRLRAGDLKRGTLLLALILAAGLMRDQQRTLLLVVMLALVFAPLAAIGLVRARRNAIPARRSPELQTAVSIAVAFVIAVGINAFELVNGFLGDPYRGGWFNDEKSGWVEKWSLSNLHTFVDRDNFLHHALSPISPSFYASMSRYLGLSLLALATLGALDAAAMRPQRRRFWLVLALLPLSAWLSFGPTPIVHGLRTTWGPVFASPLVPVLAKAAIVLAVVAFFAAAVAAAVRALRLRLPAAIGLVTVLAWAFLCTAPLPLVQRLFFFLRDFRNPDWFQVAASSFAVAFAAALGVHALASRFDGRRFWPAVLVALLATVVIDFAPYRRYLTAYQRSPAALADFQALNARLGVDPVPLRVIGGQEYSNLFDLGYLWHRKPLAWEFRSYTAPRRTLTFMKTFYFALTSTPGEPTAALLAGLANVKYLVDEPPGVAGSRWWKSAGGNSRLVAFENTLFRPYAQAYPVAHLLVGEENPDAVSLAAGLASRNVALAHLTRAPKGALSEFARVYTDAATIDAGAAPGGAVVLRRDRFPEVPSASFTTPPELSWSRPEPERIRVTASAHEPFFLLVSESYHPWWEARLDGQPLALYPAGYAFLGAFVPAGERTLELRFRVPWTHWLWGVVSLAFLLATIAAVILAIRDRASPPLIEGPP